MLFKEADLIGNVDDALGRLRLRVLDCRSCVLGNERKNPVFGEGNPNSPWVAFVGEAPGVQEDEEGKPFVGRSGNLLNKMITSMGLTREEVYICNAVCCRPPDNRKPEPAEILSCSPNLFGQLRIVRPKYIVALGATSAQALLQTNKAIGSLRGLWHEWEGTKLRVTYHPAYLLRNPSAKAEAWKDLQAVIAWVKRDKGEIPKFLDVSDDSPPG